ncbi:MAG: hypothetical protein AAGF83_01295 [Cyanobacteria bacterium P01_G01_bin.67]
MNQEITGENYLVEYHPDSATINFQGVLRLAGMIEYEAIDHLLSDVAATGPDRMTLNFEGLEFLNSSGFSVLSKFAIAMRKQQVTEIIMIGSQNISWQAKSFKNLKRLMPNLTVEFK